MKRSLLISVVLHVSTIALLWTIPVPELPHAPFARATPIVPPYRAPMPVTRKANTSPRGPLRTVVRAFHISDRLPLPAQPQVAPAIPDPPVFLSPDIGSPELPTAFSQLPAPPVRRVVAATGAFDAAVPPDHAKARTEISTGSFGDASTAAAGLHSKRASDAALSSAAEILVKPRPAYTEEARRLRIEGEVLLEVLFQASGEARVLHTIRGLGHGLDDNAITAARAIQFRPAKRGDAAVDSTAVVHIVFQLAY